MKSCEKCGINLFSPTVFSGSGFAPATRTEREDPTNKKFYEHMVNQNSENESSLSDNEPLI